MSDDLTNRGVLAGQFRLARLQVINWGTFCGYKDFPIDARGVLFTGPSGSGKSSLMDAHSIALLPTRDQRFNASADLTARGAKQGTRSVADYVRGAWSETDDEQGRSQVRYLRGGKPTWSAVGATYDDGLGSVTTAVVVKWFSGTETDGSALKSMYRLHDGHFELITLEGWAARGFDTRWLGKAYPADCPEGPEAYTRQLRKRIGLGTSKTALSLLGKAKAMKNVGDLNLFVRENMLDTPATYAAAQRMEDAFTPLNEAYETARRAHEQLKILAPIPGHWHAYGEARKEAALTERLLGAPVDRYLRAVHLGVLRTEIEGLAEKLEHLGGRLEEQLQLADQAESNYLSLENQLTRASDVLDQLGTRLKSARTEFNHRKRAFDIYASHLRRLELAPPDDEDAFLALRGMVRSKRDHAAAEKEELKPVLHDAFAEAANAKRDLQARQEELEALVRAGSLIPSKELRRRDLIAKQSGLSAAELPYVAELLDVLPGEERWRPAAEKVLRNYGLRLLVPADRQHAVKTFIDENDMHGIVEYSVVTAASEHQPRPEPGTLASKLGVNTGHPYGPWLAGQVARRFEHVCVGSARDLDEHRVAVTVRGTVKLPGNHYRKDDRPELTSPSSYILGADVVTKREALQAEITELESKRDKAAAGADDLDRRNTAIDQVVHAAEQVVAHSAWGDLDHRRSQHEIDELTERIHEIKENDVDLRRLEERRDAAKTAWQGLNDACSDLRNRITQSERRQETLTGELARQSPRPHTVDDGDREYLDALLVKLDAAVSSEGMPHLRQLLRSDLERRHQKARSRHDLALSGMKGDINRFLDKWPDSAPDGTGDVERSGGDFAALHDEISERRLPEAMGRFQLMISRDMVPSIMFVQRAIEEAARQIRERVEMVNEGLRRTEFNTGTRLQIAYTVKPFTESREFRSHVDALLRHEAAAPANAEASMGQFKRVRRLMKRFTADDAESRRWTENVLDVRQGYAFYGREETPDGVTVNTHRNTASNSGGEQEKLVAFCLAAALSYNLADAGSGGRPRFAALMLDEAFSKSDETFSAQALAAFDEFGFQLLIAAPIRMSGVLEPFIGQAILVEKRSTAEGARSNAATASFGELAARRVAEADGATDA
ncbi:ATP-binding protein [Actinomadura rugatobispora]|uniref:ATP-binding protein n=1 Tax=Actinomadura rugatobispora TaxID=1994 RepID=A0ABW1ADH6_9ACTN|nr:ATP-binding protein [Actinomadura rugatobispora]